MCAMRRIYTKSSALGGICWISLSNGYVFGQMTGMISSLQKNEDGMDLSENEIFWIASSFMVTCVLGYWFAAAVADKIGRRWSFTTFSVLLTIYWIALYMANNTMTILLSRTIGSISFGALFSLIVSVTSEYTSPETRAFFLNMSTTVAPAIGTALGHIIGIKLHWRYVSLIGILFSVLGVVLPYFWVESPHWLASRGKFAECEKSFRQLHGNKSEEELQTLIKLEKSKIDAAKSINSENTLKRLRLALQKSYFWELMLLSVIIYAYSNAAGKVVFSALATVMLSEITGSSDVLMFTLLVDGFVIIGSILSCLLVRRMTIRNLLFSTGFIANAVLIILSISLYLKLDEVYFQWINVSLLALYFIIINAGPCPLSEALISELYPLDLKLYFFFFSGITFNGFASLSLMFFPHMIASMGYHGMFLLNVTIMSLCLAYIWIKLPETKGRTLQEIEVYFKTKNFDVDKVLNSVEVRALI